MDDAQPCRRCLILKLDNFFSLQKVRYALKGFVYSSIHYAQPILHVHIHVLFSNCIRVANYIAKNL